MASLCPVFQPAASAGRAPLSPSLHLFLGWVQRRSPDPGKRSPGVSATCACPFRAPLLKRQLKGPMVEGNPLDDLKGDGGKRAKEAEIERGYSRARTPVWTQGIATPRPSLGFPPQAGPERRRRAVRGAGGRVRVEFWVHPAPNLGEPRSVSRKSNRKQTGKGECGALPRGPDPKSGGSCSRQRPSGSAGAGPTGRRCSPGLTRPLGPQHATRRRPRPVTCTRARARWLTLGEPRAPPRSREPTDPPLVLPPSAGFPLSLKLPVCLLRLGCIPFLLLTPGPSNSPPLVVACALGELA